MTLGGVHGGDRGGDLAAVVPHGGVLEALIVEFEFARNRRVVRVPTHHHAVNLRSHLLVIVRVIIVVVQVVVQILPLVREVLRESCSFLERGPRRLVQLAGELVDGGLGLG